MFCREVKFDAGKYAVNINPAVECLGVLFLLAEFERNKIRCNKGYVDNICAWFGKFKQHAAVKTIKQLLKNDYFKYDLSVEMFLKIFYKQGFDEEFCIKHKLNKKIVDRFVLELTDFVEKSNFNQFFKENVQLYLNKAQNFVDELKNYSPADYLIDFLNLRAKKLKVLLMFGVTSANYGVKINNTAYCCVRPYKLSRYDDMDFAYDKIYVTTLVLHEYAHSYINDLTDKYSDMLARVDKQKFELCFKLNAYGTDEKTAINEHVIRAIECLYVCKNFKNDSLNFIKKYVGDGFTYIVQLMDLFKNYLKNKQKFKNFAQFYPKIIEFFVNL